MVNMSFMKMVLNKCLNQTHDSYDTREVMVTTDTSSLKDVVFELSLPESTELVECEGVFKIPVLAVAIPTGLLLT